MRGDKRYIILKDYKIIDKLKYKIRVEKDETDESCNAAKQR